MNIKWDADKYTDNFSFVHQYGESLIDLLDIYNDMTVLDLGCGNGALTHKIAQTGAQAIGMDASNELLQIAKNNYPDLEFIWSDATDFTLDEKVDAVFSNAVFHWIDEKKQPELLKCIYSALNNNGQLVFEFGGYGNNDIIHSALKKVFKEHGLNYKTPFYFPTTSQYSALLEQSGFKVEYIILFDRMTRLNGQNGLEDWIRMFVKKPFENISDRDKNIIINQAVNMLKADLFHDGVWYADYVRIRGKAIKKSG